ncbi:hypothetical protein BGZ95_003024, partial [Linnemannia exigua]
MFFSRCNMPFSAKSALIVARPHIDAARQAQSTKDIIQQYRDAKNTLANVDAKKEDIHSLKEMIDAFYELAAVLDSKGPATQKKAEKCKARAAILEQELNRINTFASAITMSLIGTPLVAVSSLPKRSTTTVTVVNNSAAIPATTSTGNFVSPATFAPQQKPRSTPQAAVSLSAAIGSAKTSLLFSKKADRAPFVYRLPAPGEQLETTRQLAYCLALLQDSIDGTRLDPDTLAWRRDTLKNSDESIRMETITRQVVTEFIEKPEKNTAEVEEVVQLVQVLHKEISQSLLKSFVDTVSKSTLLHLHAMEGLARVIQEATPGSNDSNDLVTILQVLYTRLQATHSPSSGHLCPLLLAVSRVLDAMVVAKVGDVDRVALHGPLTTLLHEMESHQDPYVAFQAKYATQALLNVTDNDTIWQAGFRRGWLVLKGAAGFAKIPDPKDIKDALEGLENLYQAGQGAVRMLNNTWVAVKTGEKLSFTAKEGLKFKRIWYEALRTAKKYMQTGELAGFKELVTSAPCRDQAEFQLGICQLLGQFAVDTQWDLESRRSTLPFLAALCQDDNAWSRQKGLEQVFLDMISILAVNHGNGLEAAKAMQEMIQQQDLALTPLTDLQSHPWNGFLSADPTNHATPASTLLMAVQNKKRQEERVETIQSGVEQIAEQIRPVHSSLEDIQSALKTHYERDLFIRRISGDKLDLAKSFVNLAIVESPEQREKEKQNTKEQAAIFHRIPSSETVQGSNIESSIRLEQLFDKRKLRDGKEDAPKRILVQGRAGIGKTTLCKKLVHAHQNGLWRNHFDAVLWIPLRQLRGSTCRTLQGLLREKFFDAQHFDREQEDLARTLTARADEGKVLFILDGLDEIATDAQGEGNSLIALLEILFRQHHVVITSRPSGLNRELLRQIDLELETIGFSHQDVETFIHNVLDPEPARTVQDFIQRMPLLQGLVNIPVQLDVVCFCWNSLPVDGSQLTMTRLYQLMVRKLWCKDALRLKKEAGDQVLTEQEINDLPSEEIDELMTVEMHHLGFLAFKGLVNNHQIEFDHQTLLTTFNDLKGHRKRLNNGSLFSSQLLEMLKKTSFLHAADADVDPKKKNSQQTWSFLHLTFQEYFAAIWITLKMTTAGEDGLNLSAGSMKTTPTVRFVQEHKYNPRLEIVWWMVAGLLEGEALEIFFDLLQGGPRDLIGGRHQQLLASCLDEARARLDTTVVARLDAELLAWLHFEIRSCPSQDRSLLGSRASFPEALLLQSWDSILSQKSILVGTLGSRPWLSEPAIQHLIASLKDEDYNIRRPAVWALGKQSAFPESAIQSLVATLKDEHVYVRQSAIDALGSQSTLPESAIQSLIASLEDECSVVWESVVESLGNQSTLPESAIQFLIAALTGFDADVGWLARKALSNQSILPESAIQSLFASLKDEDADVRRRVAWVLGAQSTLPGSVIQSLIASLKDEHADVRKSAAEYLGNQSILPESAIQSLIATLKDEKADVRKSAAEALGMRPTLPESAIQPLIAILKDEDADVRKSTAKALGKQPTLPESAIQSLIASLKDEDGDVKMLAAELLGNQSTLSESAVQSLIDTLKDEKADVRMSAVWPLIKQSTLPESVIQDLVATLKDEDARVRELAAWALGDQSESPESVILSLIATLKDDEADVRQRAAKALSNQSTLPHSASKSLISILMDEDADADVRLSAASALGKQSTLPESLIQSLIATLKDEDAGMVARQSVASVLCKQSTLPESAIQSLIAILKDEDAYASSSAASVLYCQSTLPESAIQSLHASLKDGYAYVRQSAATALISQSSLPESAIQSLVASLKDEDEDIRRSAIRALGNQSSLPESAIQSLVASLKDEDTYVMLSAAEALDNQSTLPESAIQSLIATLKHKYTEVRNSAAVLLSSQSTLPESAIQPLLTILKYEKADVRRSTAGLLGKQSILPASAIQALIVALKDEDADVRRTASEAIYSRCQSLCTALPSLSEDELVSV